MNWTEAAQRLRETFIDLAAAIREGMKDPISSQPVLSSVQTLADARELALRVGHSMAAAGASLITSASDSLLFPGLFNNNALCHANQITELERLERSLTASPGQRDQAVDAWVHRVNTRGSGDRNDEITALYDAAGLAMAGRALHTALAVDNGAPSEVDLGRLGLVMATMRYNCKDYVAQPEKFLQALYLPRAMLTDWTKFVKDHVAEQPDAAPAAGSGNGTRTAELGVGLH